MFPVLLRLGHVTVPTYGVLAAVGLGLALWLSLHTARLAGLAPDAVWDAGLFAVVAAFALSRVLLVAGNLRSFASAPLVLLAMPSLTATGLLGTALFTAAWLRWKRLPLLAVLDAWAPCAAVVWGFFALGHVAEGSDLGVPGFVGGRKYPVALFTAGFAGLLAWGLWVRLTRGRRGDTLAMGLVCGGLGEFGLGFVRQPDVSGVTTLLDPSQWFALGMIVVGVMVGGRKTHSSRETEAR